MKKFEVSSKRRLVILWILLAAWFLISTLICGILLEAYHSPIVFIVYFILSFPIVHLIIYTKPLNTYEIIEIICMNLFLVNILCAFIFIKVPGWVFISLAAVYMSATCICFILESLIMVKILKGRKKG